ncbi:MAG: type III pantothenate kinase [Thauera sp.]|nr:type III pantothenate kinase [Thauera sp.]
MILLLDAGNTRVKWCAMDTGARAALDEGACAHDEVEALAAVLRRHSAITRIVGTNVAGLAMANRIDAIARAVDLVPQWLTPLPYCCGVSSRYDKPAQLGADRWAALIGARQLHQADCLVVSAGTATTIDLLTADGHFEGGLILPGVELMQRALADGTAQLPLAHGRFALTPRCTADAIHSGCLQAQAGAVERMFRQIADRPGALCLLAGGAADQFANLLDIPVRRIDNLVLIGLQAIVRTG